MPDAIAVHPVAALRTQVHLAENEAYAIEMRFWYRIERILRDGGTVAEAVWFASQDDE